MKAKLIGCKADNQKIEIHPEYPLKQEIMTLLYDFQFNHVELEYEYNQDRFIIDYWNTGKRIIQSTPHIDYNGLIGENNYSPNQYQYN